MVKRLTLAQVVILQFVGSSSTSGSLLTVRSLLLIPPSLSAPSQLMPSLSLSKINKHEKYNYRGTRVAQFVGHLTLAQVMILLFMSSSSVSGSVLTAQSLEPASDSVSPSLSSALPPLMRHLFQK